MDLVFSNGKRQCSEDEIINMAKQFSVRDVELYVDRKRLLELESLNGDDEVELLKNRLSIERLNLYGFCLYTDFNLVEDIMLAKKCINLLNRLEGKMLRLIMKPIPKDEVMERTYGSIETFLNSLARFASYSAGVGKGETTVRIAFDVLTQPGFGYSDVLRINNALQASRNVGVAIDADNTGKIGEIKKIMRQANGYEFTINHIAVNDSLDNTVVETILSEAAQAYDGKIVVEPGQNANKTNELVNTVGGLKYNEDLMDYTKISYQSSIARIFRKFGVAYIEPAADITVGARGTWKYVYRVGSQGIKKNGGLKVGFHHSTNWEAFQIENPKADGFVSIRATGRAKLETKLTVLDASRFIHIIVTDGELKQDEEIIIVIGDTTKSSRGSRAQTFAQQGFAFLTLVDADGFGSYFQHPDPPAINILGGRADRIKVFAPSTVVRNESFDVNIRVEDAYHNTATGYKSDFKASINGKELDNIRYKTINGNNAVVCIKDVSLKYEGIYVVDVIDNNGIKGSSNSIQCTSNKNEYKVYWGDIHCHLGYMDSIGTVDQMYDYARNVSFLDFVCHAEHMDSYSGGRQASNPIQWNILKEAVKKYNEHGRFITILGYENSEIWDANIYFPGDDAPWHVDSFARRLFAFARRHNAVVIPHMTTYPQRIRGYDWANYEEDVVRAMEICSSHGCSEYFGGERPLTNCEPGGYAVDALNMGHKLAFIGSSDGHDCMPGNSTYGPYMNGLIAVYTKELSREAIFDAIKNRRCYATTNARILGYFDINGNMSGSEIEVRNNSDVKINVSLYGTDDIEIVNIVKNGVIIYSKEGNGRNVEFEIEDKPDRKGHNYYYVKMKQKDGEMAWLSPVFVNVTG
jgi:hypothetical protein